ncbi:MAG: acyl-CoA dehydrogenase family protein [Caulobacteraceae bacterium]
MTDLQASPAAYDGRLDAPFELAVRVSAVVEIARAHAVDVDAQPRFPDEALAAMKALGLLGLMAPQPLGGEGASVSQLADVCYRLGGACPAAAMIFAMHQIKVACLVRHSEGSSWHKEFLRLIAHDQLLLASSTTEGAGGGDVRSSSAPIEQSDGHISLVRDATVMSYGEQADAVVTTARRAPDAAAADQALVVFTRDQYTLERTNDWDTLGMRGTCSAGFILKAKAPVDQILPVRYADIHAHTMTPVAHLLWTAVWAGVAASAVERARRCLRKPLRNANFQLPLGLTHFTQATSSLRLLRALLADALARFEALASTPGGLTSPSQQTAVTLLKVQASELAVDTVMSAMRACGLSGYRNDGPASLGRHLRDILSAPIMINNDRLLADLSIAPLIGETPASIWP